MQEPIRVTYLPVLGKEPVPVYSAPDGIPVVVWDTPFYETDGRSLVSPPYIVDAGEPTWVDSTGTIQEALAVTGLTPVDPEIPLNAVTVDGVPVTHNGEIVTHA